MQYLILDTGKLQDGFEQKMEAFQKVTGLKTISNRQQVATFDEACGRVLLFNDDCEDVIIILYKPISLADIEMLRAGAPCKVHIIVLTNESGAWQYEINRHPQTTKEFAL